MRHESARNQWIPASAGMTLVPQPRPRRWHHSRCRGNDGRNAGLLEPALSLQLNQVLPAASPGSAGIYLPAADNKTDIARLNPLEQSRAFGPLRARCPRSQERHHIPCRSEAQPCQQCHSREAGIHTALSEYECATPGVARRMCRPPPGSGLSCAKARSKAARFATRGRLGQRSPRIRWVARRRGIGKNGEAHRVGCDRVSCTPGKNAP